MPERVGATQRSRVPEAIVKLIDIGMMLEPLGVPPGVMMPDCPEIIPEQEAETFGAPNG